MTKDINVEGMTRGDFEQMFGDVKQSFTHEIVKSNDQLNTKIGMVHADLSESIDALGSRSDGDHAALVADFKI